MSLSGLDEIIYQLNTPGYIQAWTIIASNHMSERNK